MVVSPGIDAWSLLYERSDESAANSYRDASIEDIAGTLVGDTLTVPGVTSSEGADFGLSTTQTSGFPTIPIGSMVVVGDGAGFEDEFLATGPYFIRLWTPTTDETGEIVEVSSRSGLDLFLATPTVGAYTGGVSRVALVQLAAFEGFSPSAGDVLAGSGSAIARIASVSNDGSDWTLTLESGHGISAGAVTLTWHQAIACAVEWQAQHLPGLGSRWQEAHVVLEADASAYAASWPLAVGGQPSEASAPSAITATVTPNSAPYQTIRVGLPRAIVRAYQMGPRLAVTAAGVLWRVAELALHFTAQSPKVRR